MASDPPPYPLAFPPEVASAAAAQAWLRRQLPAELPFPHKRHFMPPPAQLFAGLQLQLVEVVVPAGAADAEFRVAPDAYETADQLADFYTEPQRVQSCRRGQPSPLQVWEDRRRNPRALATRAAQLYASLGPRPAAVRLLREAVYGMAQECTQFKPSLSKAVYEHLAAELQMPAAELQVLDPCAGWGDRLLGALAAGVDHYTGVDPNGLLHPAYQQMLAAHGRPGQASFHALPFEEFAPPGRYDVVFTSPPFADFELYHCSDAAAQCNVRHGGAQAWARDWLHPQVLAMWRALRPGGLLALHLSDTSAARVCEGLVAAMAAAGVPLWARYACRSGDKRPLPIWVWRR